MKRPFLSLVIMPLCALTLAQDTAAPKVSYTILVDNRLRVAPVVRYELARIEGFRLLGSEDVQAWALTGIQTGANAATEPKLAFGGALVLPWKLGRNAYVYAGVRGQVVQDRPMQLGIVLGIEIR